MKIEYPEIGRIYQHYKGGRYEVITLCRHSERDDEVLVIYKSIEYGSVHARPLEMWFDDVDTYIKGAVAGENIDIFNGTCKRFQIWE